MGEKSKGSVGLTENQNHKGLSYVWMKNIDETKKCLLWLSGTSICANVSYFSELTFINVRT